MVSAVTVMLMIAAWAPVLPGPRLPSAPYGVSQY